MQIIRVQVFGDIEEFAYFYIGNDNRAFIIDPGAEADKFKEIAAKNGLNIAAILLTHGHFDHIGAAKTLADFFSVHIYGGIGSNSYTADPKKNLSLFTGKTISFDNVLEKAEGESLKLDEEHELNVLSTQGHTEDGVTYYDEKNGVAFVGDTIFEGSYGRTDFPGGDANKLFKSIREKILTLPKSTSLYSGHSAATTVAAEMDYYA